MPIGKSKGADGSGSRVRHASSCLRSGAGLARVEDSCMRIGVMIQAFAASAAWLRRFSRRDYLHLLALAAVTVAAVWFALGHWHTDIAVFSRNSLESELYREELPFRRIRFHQVVSSRTDLHALAISLDEYPFLPQQLASHPIVCQCLGRLPLNHEGRAADLLELLVRHCSRESPVDGA